MISAVRTVFEDDEFHVIEGLAYPFRGRDTYGTYFSARSDFHWDLFPDSTEEPQYTRPLTFQHGFDPEFGLTRVGLEATNADANQQNRNLILSETAKADSDPVLEILTSNIIRCSHGATAGPVDQEQLFYLQARGIPYKAAEALLVRAFLGQVLDQVPGEELREELATIIDRKLSA